MGASGHLDMLRYFCAYFIIVSISTPVYSALTFVSDAFRLFPSTQLINLKKILLLKRKFMSAVINVNIPTEATAGEASSCSGDKAVK